MPEPNSIEQYIFYDAEDEKEQQTTFTQKIQAKSIANGTFTWSATQLVTFMKLHSPSLCFHILPDDDKIHKSVERGGHPTHGLA